MERLITVKTVSERNGCSMQTARKYIRQCNPHMEDPLATTEMAFREWEASRTVTTGSKKQKAEIQRRLTSGRVIVPRRRGEA